MTMNVTPSRWKKTPEDEEAKERLEQRRQQRPAVSPCSIDEHTEGAPLTASAAPPDPSNGESQRGPRVVRMVMMRPQRRSKRTTKRGYSIGSMQPGTL